MTAKRSWGPPVLIALLLAGCSSVPNAVNPVEWYRSASDAMSSKPPAQPSATDPKMAEAQAKSAPNLASVPPRPTRASTPAERQALTQGLVADRENAKYTDDELGPRTAPPPPPPAPAAAAPAAPQAAPRTVVIAAPPSALEGSFAPLRPVMPSVAPPAPPPVAAAAPTSPPPAPPPAPSAPSASPPVAAVVPPSPPSAPPPAVAGTDNTSMQPVPPPAPPTMPQMSSALAPTRAAAPRPTPPAAAQAPAASASEVPSVSEMYRQQLERPGTAPLASPVVAAAPAPAAMAAPAPAAAVAPAPAASASGVPSVSDMYRQQGARPGASPVPAQTAMASAASTPSGNVDQVYRQQLARSESVVQLRPPAAEPAPPPPSQPPRMGALQHTAREPAKSQVTYIGGTTGIMPTTVLRPGEPVAAIQFGEGSSRIGNAGRDSLARIAGIAQEMGGRIRIVGHAGRPNGGEGTKSEIAEFGLSLNRANAVAQELMKNGIPAERMVIEAVGDAEPLVIGGSAAAEAPNRRAEIFVE